MSAQRPSTGRALTRAHPCRYPPPLRTTENRKADTGFKSTCRPSAQIAARADVRTGRRLAVHPWQSHQRRARRGLSRDPTWRTSTGLVLTAYG